jgi:hypothetical protein
MHSFALLLLQNALPESAEATFNVRIDFSQTPEQILDIFAHPVVPLAQRFNLTLIAANSSVLHTPEHSEGTVTLGVTGEKGLPVAPITPLSGKAWEIFSWASRRVWEEKSDGAVGAGGEVIVAPSVGFRQSTGRVLGHRCSWSRLLTRLSIRSPVSLL